MTTTMELPDIEIDSGKPELPEPPEPPRPRLLAGAYRVPTLGIVLVVTLLAFEAMAVGTVMPVVAQDLDGLSLYGWSFSSLLIASMLATVLAGGWIDRSGPARPLLIGLATFVAGLLVAGSASSMWMLVLGRTIQGLGSGVSLVAVYVVIARVYPEYLRPRVFAALSTAWVLPSLVGPALGGVVAEQLNWRWVFLGLIPLVVPAGIMLVPALRELKNGDHEPASPRRGRVPAAFAAAAGAGALLYAVDHAGWALLPVAALGLAGLGLGLPRLLPAGALRLRRGVPTTVVLRGLMAGAFFGMDVFIPLALTSLHGFSATEAGVVLTVGALGWSGSSQFQGRSRRPRQFFVMLGAVLVTAGVAAAAIALQVGGWWVALAWIIGGAGMGFALSSLSVLVLNQSAEDEQGVNSSALQLADTLGASLAVGIAGALAISFGTDHLALGIGVGSALLIAIALAAVIASFRVEARS